MQIQTSLKLQAEENVQNFPQGTRFSLDQGASWFVLYREGDIPVDVPAGETVVVMLDLSATALTAEPGLTITNGIDAAVTLMAATDPVFRMDSQVLTRDSELMIQFADLWQDCQLICSVDMLVSTETGKTYIPAEISSNGLMAELSNGENGQQLAISIGDTLPQAGTYRVNMCWLYNGISIWQEKTNFFINYTGDIITNQTGGDRQ